MLVKDDMGDLGWAFAPGIGPDADALIVPTSLYPQVTPLGPAKASSPGLSPYLGVLLGVGALVGAVVFFRKSR